MPPSMNKTKNNFLGCEVYTSDYLPSGYYALAVSKICKHCGKLLSRVINPCAASPDGRHEPDTVAVLMNGDDYAHKNQNKIQRL